MFSIVIVLCTISVLMPIFPAAAAPESSNLWAWGNNFSGQLGNGVNTNSDIPVIVSGLGDVISVASSGSHTLALKPDGTVWAWGANDSGELGDGTNNPSNTPVQVMGLTDIIAIAAHSGSGDNHSMALKSDGTVWVWGDNSDGQLCNGTRDDSNIPVLISGVTGVVAIDAGDDNCMALKSDGTVWGWGENHTHGKLGNGTNKDPARGTVVQTIGITDAIAIVESSEHGLALMSDGTVWAWGGNSSGQLGNYGNNDCYQPAPILGLYKVTAIATGALHNLALKSDGTVWAWGDNSRGQLGIGTVSLSYNFLVQVVGLTDVVAIAAGGNQSLALKSDGTVWAWGANYNGQLGNGTEIDSSIPVQVPGLTNVIGINTSGIQGFAIVKNELTPAPTETASVSATTPTTAPTSSTPVTEPPGGENNYGWWVWLILGIAVTSVVIILIIRFKTRISKYF